MEKFSWLDDFLEEKIDEGEVEIKANNANLTALDMFAVAVAVIQHRETRESHQKRKVSFSAAAARDDDSDDDDDDDDNGDDDYEAAYLKDERKEERRMSRASNSAPKKLETHVNGNKCSDAISKEERLIREKSLKAPMIIDETPLLVSNQGRLEIGSSSAFNCSSYSTKKRSVKEIASSSSDSPTKQERLKREKILKAPATSPQPKKSKKTIIAKRGPMTPPPVLPDQFRKIITELGGTDIRMVIQKPLTVTDIKRSQARLSMPLSKIENFLTEEEKANLANKTPMAVELVDTKCSKCDGMTLRRWEMKKNPGASNPIYVLTTEWNNLVSSNRLKSGNIVQVWSFRVGFQLHLALVRVRKGEAADDDDDDDDDDDEEEEEEEKEDGNDVGIGSSSSANQSTEEETQEQE